MSPKNGDTRMNIDEALENYASGDLAAEEQRELAIPREIPMPWP